MEIAAGASRPQNQLAFTNHRLSNAKWPRCKGSPPFFFGVDSNRLGVSSPRSALAASPRNSSLPHNARAARLGFFLRSSASGLAPDSALLPRLFLILECGTCSRFSSPAKAMCRVYAREEKRLTRNHCTHAHETSGASRPHLQRNSMPPIGYGVWTAIIFPPACICPCSSPPLADAKSPPGEITKSPAFVRDIAATIICRTSTKRRCKNRCAQGN